MTNRRGRRLAAAGLGLAGLVAAAGCTGTETISGPPGPERVSLDDVRLVAFDSCDGLLDWFHTEAAARVGPYGLETSPGRGWATDDMAFTSESADDTAAAEAPQAAGATGSDGATSTTNTQEVGVGEPDVAWTDGRRLVTVVNGALQVVDLEAGAVTAEVDLTPDEDASATPIGLLVEGDHALVLQRAWWYDERTAEDAASFRAPGEGRTVLTRVELGGAPEVVGEITVDGDYVDARMVDGVVRAVVRSSPADLGFVYPSGGSEAAARRAEEANRALVAETTVEDWLPSMTVEADGREGSVSAAVECEAVDHPAEFGGFDVVTVVGLDLAAGAVDPLPSAAVVAGAGTVYASTGNLYVTTTRYPVPGWAERGSSPTTTTPDDGTDHERTDVHAFSLPAGVAARYEASGSVAGDLVGQFALSEHDGDLRVASTTRPGGWWVGPLDGDVVGGDAEETTPDTVPQVSESRVTVLRRDGDELAEVGRVTGLGPTEQIQGVRFAGPLAYVVTFRQTDPLYVVDLRDPAAPVVAGELKIPGFSSYLQVIGEGRVLGIGQDATDQGRTIGFQESLFDVSDPTDPRRVAQLVVPNGSSTAEDDHHALLWWEPEQLLAVPVSRWVEGDSRSGVLVTTVTDASIVERGTITHPDPYGGRPLPVPDCPPGAVCALPVEPDGGPGWSSPTAAIERTLVASGRLVTVSSAGVKVSDMATLADLGWVPLV